MYFPNEDPIGRRIRLVPENVLNAPADWLTVVGVSPAVRQRSTDESDVDPVAYLPLRATGAANHTQITVTSLDQNGNPAEAPGVFTLIVRASSEPAKLAAVIREQVRALDPDLPVFDIRTLDQRLSNSRWFERVTATMFSIFAGLALLLSGVGLYAVAAYSVAQRTQEIGIRLAMGARRQQIGWFVLREALLLVGIGIASGFVAALAMGTLLHSVFVGTSAHDPLVLSSIVILLVSVSVVASLLPALCAASMDPLAALRYE